MTREKRRCTDDVGVLDDVLEMVGGWLPSGGVSHGTAT